MTVYSATRTYCVGLISEAATELPSDEVGLYCTLLFGGPCTLSDICNVENLKPERVREMLESLIKNNRVQEEVAK